MNKMNSSHHMNEYTKMSNFLQFECHSSKCFKVRAIISDLRDLYGNKIQSPTSLTFMFHTKNVYNVQVQVECTMSKYNVETVQKYQFGWGLLNDTSIS